MIGKTTEVWTKAHKGTKPLGLPWLKENGYTQRNKTFV